MKKYSVFTQKDRNWEYRCNSCSQLRFSPTKEKPKVCGACCSYDISVGRPGELSTLTEKQ